MISKRPKTNKECWWLQSNVTRAAHEGQLLSALLYLFACLPDQHHDECLHNYCITAVISIEAGCGKTAGRCGKSLQMSNQANITFDRLLVYYSHEEALFVNIAPVNTVLGRALVKQPVHKGSVALSISVDSCYCLQLSQKPYEAACLSKLHAPLLQRLQMQEQQQRMCVQSLRQVETGVDTHCAVKI